MRSRETAVVDDSRGKFVNELERQNLYDETLIIVSAKHGQ